MFIKNTNGFFGLSIPQSCRFVNEGSDCWTKECSNNSIARLGTVCCLKEFPKYIFKDFNFENGRSVLVEVTGIDKNNIKAVQGRLTTQNNHYH